MVHQPQVSRSPLGSGRQVDPNSNMGSRKGVGMLTSIVRLGSYVTIAYSLVSSTPAMSQWILASETANRIFLTFATKDSLLFAGGYNGAVRSTDNGLTWGPIDSGFVKIGGAINYLLIRS
jgi:hypothetical protein